VGVTKGPEGVVQHKGTFGKHRKPCAGKVSGLELRPEDFVNFLVRRIVCGWAEAADEVLERKIIFLVIECEG
jgi:hypothetical protein